MKFYHATTMENLEKIRNEQRIRHSVGGVVFLCRKPLDACKFLLIRGVSEIGVIEVDLKKSETERSNDHSEKFFQCKAYTYHGDIVLTGAEEIKTYDFGLLME